jgi:hypothetical protein
MPFRRGWRAVGAWRRWALVTGFLLVVSTELAAAQVSGPALSVDTASLGHGRYSRMRTKLEKTIFKVDVLTVEVRLGEQETARLEEIAAGRSDWRGPADSIAAVAIHSRDAFVAITFLRDVSLGQFVDGIDDNLRRVAEAELIGRSDYEMIRDGLPRWFGFLGERGIRKGDRILYRIRGDTLRTWFIGNPGGVLLDQTDVGPERRLAVLGSYFVRGSDFREGLIRSLFRRVP